jgi:hypothetical protein
MTDRVFPLNRRRLLAGLGATVLGPAIPSVTPAQGRTPLMLQAKPSTSPLRPGQPDTPIWSLVTPDAGLRFRCGDQLEVVLGNDLPVPVVLNWHGVDGAPAAEPLAARPPLVPGAKDSFALPLRHAGTFLCDLRLLGDGQARPLPARALVVGESEPVIVDRDEVVLIEDWRLRSDGSATAPGSDAKDTKPLYTINGRTSLDITTRANERLRLRFINGYRQPAMRAVSGAQQSACAGARNADRCLRRCRQASRLDVLDLAARRHRAPPDSPAGLFQRCADPERSAAAGSCVAI